MGINSSAEEIGFDVYQMGKCLILTIEHVNWSPKVLSQRTPITEPSLGTVTSHPCTAKDHSHLVCAQIVSQDYQNER